jgi:hypothetical protein
VTVAEGEAEGVAVGSGVGVLDGVVEGGTGVKVGKAVRVGTGVMVISTRSVVGPVDGTMPGAQLAIKNIPVAIKQIQYWIPSGMLLVIITGKLNIDVIAPAGFGSVEIKRARGIGK